MTSLISFSWEYWNLRCQDTSRFTLVLIVVTMSFGSTSALKICLSSEKSQFCVCGRGEQETDSWKPENILGAVFFQILFRLCHFIGLNQGVCPRCVRGVSCRNILTPRNMARDALRSIRKMFIVSRDRGNLIRRDKHRDKWLIWTISEEFESETQMRSLCLTSPLPTTNWDHCHIVREGDSGWGGLWLQ